ncbi:hypothetical protein L6164_022602 [Bauhinia variegata]|uniref:Uncharacterized protein n=1 Tax=Bauhinia variegata TaxID=167791 RepID=A0ACB9MFQ7_BAUVA|nr:hypothetical protein L6164_022602 [Bauhinia variegata]
MEFQGTLCFLFIIFAGLLSHSEARKFYVGNKDGWVLNPSQDYNTWAGKSRFLISDTLVFKYNKGSDSVLEVSKDDYEKCNTKNPIKKFDDGNSEFTFDRSGPFYFISGKDGNCGKGQKLIVVVLSTKQQTPPKAPSPGSQPPSVTPSPPKAPSPGSQAPSGSVPATPGAPSPTSGTPSVPTPSKSPSPVSQPPMAQSPGGTAPPGSPTTPSPSSSVTPSPSGNPPLSPTSPSPAGNTPSASPGVSPAGGPTAMSPPAPSPAGSPTAVTPSSSMPGPAPSGAPTSSNGPAMGPGAPGSPSSSSETTPSSAPGSSARAITPPSFMVYSVTVVLCAAVGAILGTQ